MIMGQCPSSFRMMPGFTCVSECPTEKGFEFQMSPGGQPRCVYKDSPDIFVNLSPLQAVQNGGKLTPNLTLESLKTMDASLYGAYVAEQSRVTQELAILYEKISKDKKLRDAFKRLQDAENARDKAPDAYQQARSNYYTIKEGETWKERERDRILKSEVEPLAKKFISMRESALNQFESQRKTVDVVTGLKDKVLSLRDEVKYAADTFKEQLGKVENAINRERRERTATPDTSIWTWFDTLLNIAILASLVYVGFMVFRKFGNRQPAAPAVMPQA